MQSKSSALTFFLLPISQNTNIKHTRIWTSSRLNQTQLKQELPTFNGQNFFKLKDVFINSESLAKCMYCFFVYINFTISLRRKDKYPRLKFIKLFFNVGRMFRLLPGLKIGRSGASKEDFSKINLQFCA